MSNTGLLEPLLEPAALAEALRTRGFALLPVRWREGAGHLKGLGALLSALEVEEKDAQKMAELLPPRHRLRGGVKAQAGMKRRLQLKRPKGFVGTCGGKGGGVEVLASSHPIDLIFGALESLADWCFEAVCERSGIPHDQVCRHLFPIEKGSAPKGPPRSPPHSLGRPAAEARPAAGTAAGTSVDAARAAEAAEAADTPSATSAPRSGTGAASGAETVACTGTEGTLSPPKHATKHAPKNAPRDDDAPRAWGSTGLCKGRLGRGHRGLPGGARTKAVLNAMRYLDGGGGGGGGNGGGGLQGGLSGGGGEGWPQVEPWCREHFDPGVVTLLARSDLAALQLKLKQPTLPKSGAAGGGGAGSGAAGSGAKAGSGHPDHPSGGGDEGAGSSFEWFDVEPAMDAALAKALLDYGGRGGRGGSGGDGGAWSEVVGGLGGGVDGDATEGDGPGDAAKGRTEILLVLVGCTLERLTGGEVRACEHRVPRSAARLGVTRTTAAFELRPTAEVWASWAELKGAPPLPH